MIRREKTNVRRNEFMKLDTRVFPDIDALSRGRIEELLSDLQAAIEAARPWGHCAFRGAIRQKKCTRSGRANEKISQRNPLGSVHFFWGDERYVRRTIR